MAKWITIDHQGAAKAAIVRDRHLIIQWLAINGVSARSTNEVVSLTKTQMAVSLTYKEVSTVITIIFPKEVPQAIRCSMSVLTITSWTLVECLTRITWRVWISASKSPKRRWKIAISIMTKKILSKKWIEKVSACKRHWINLRCLPNRNIRVKR